MAESQPVRAGGAHTMTAEKKDALLFLDADVAGGGILHLLYLYLKALVPFEPTFCLPCQDH